MLRVKTVNHHSNPRYPAKEHAQAHPELLERLPERWRACRQAAMAAGILASMSTTLSACQKTPEIVGTMAPPAYVTEADAMEIIKTSLAGYMPDLKEEVPVETIKKPIRYLYNEYGYPSMQATHPSVDLFDSRLNIGIEYVDSEVFPFSPDTTSETADQIGKDQACVLVIWRTEADTTMAAEGKLRQQIADFLEWLKAQGIV